MMRKENESVEKSRIEEIKDEITRLRSKGRMNCILISCKQLAMGYSMFGGYVDFSNHEQAELNRRNEKARRIGDRIDLLERELAVLLKEKEHQVGFKK